MSEPAVASNSVERGAHPPEAPGPKHRVPSVAPTRANELAIGGFALLLRLKEAHPADEIARLLQFAGSIKMAKVGGKQAILLLQCRQFRIEPINVPNDLFPFHGPKPLRHPPNNNAGKTS